MDFGHEARFYLPLVGGESDFNILAKLSDGTPSPAKA